MSASSTAEISGATRVLFILADPVAHVRTPQAINALAQRYSADCVMVPCEVAPANLGVVVRALRSALEPEVQPWEGWRTAGTLVIFRPLQATPWVEAGR